MPEIFAQSGYQAVIAVPQVNLGHAYQVNTSIARLRKVVQGYAVYINAVAYPDGALSEDGVGIREGDDGIHPARQTPPEQLVYRQPQPRGPREGSELLVIGVCGNLRHGLHTQPAQPSEETDKPGVGILETAGIDKLYAISLTIIIDAPVTSTLAHGGQKARAIVLQHLTVDKTAAMSLCREIIVAQMDFMTILAEAFNLIVYLLADTTHSRKTMIDKEKNFHYLHIFVQKYK